MNDNVCCSYSQVFPNQTLLFAENKISIYSKTIWHQIWHPPFDVLDTSSKFSCNRIPNHFAGYKWVSGCYITKRYAITQHPNTSWLKAFSDTDNHTCATYNKNGEALILQKSIKGHQFSINLLEVIPIHHTIMELIIIARRAQQQIYSETIQLSELVTHIVA
jgi:hypothetical protein